ncbi:MAG: glycosyl hydrolase 108 family protein [Mesorhizobium sp.]
MNFTQSSTRHHTRATHSASSTTARKKHLMDRWSHHCPKTQHLVPPLTLPPHLQGRQIWIAIFAKALSLILKSEGGWRDNSEDPGGGAMKGVKLAKIESNQLISLVTPNTLNQRVQSSIL